MHAHGIRSEFDRLFDGAYRHLVVRIRSKRGGCAHMDDKPDIVPISAMPVLDHPFLHKDCICAALCNLVYNLPDVYESFYRTLRYSMIHWNNQHVSALPIEDPFKPYLLSYFWHGFTISFINAILQNRWYYKYCLIIKLSGANTIVKYKILQSSLLWSIQPV